MLEILILVGFIAAVATFILLAIRKTENRRRKWFKTTKVGDACRISAVGDSHLNNVKITSFDGDYATVEVRIKKRWLYPPENK